MEAWSAFSPCSALPKKVQFLCRTLSKTPFASKDEKWRRTEGLTFGADKDCAYLPLLRG